MAGTKSNTAWGRSRAALVMIFVATLMISLAAGMGPKPVQAAAVPGLDRETLRDRCSLLLGRVIEERRRLSALAFLLERMPADRSGNSEQTELTLGVRAAQSQLRVLETRMWEALSRTVRSGIGGGTDHARALVEDVQRRLLAVSDSGQTLLERLQALATGNVGLLEKEVAATGLNVEALLAATDKPFGQGGPFIAAGSARGGMAAKLLDLDKSVVRWANLGQLIKALPLGSPLKEVRVTSGYGWRRDPIRGKAALHAGIDLGADYGTPVYATAPGKVVTARWVGDYGRMIEIDHGMGIRTRYGHLRNIHVKEGDVITPGQRIGRVGSSGRTTGPHLHYEVLVDDQPRNPVNFIKAGPEPMR